MITVKEFKATCEEALRTLDGREMRRAWMIAGTLDSDRGAHRDARRLIDGLLKAVPAEWPAPPVTSTEVKALSQPGSDRMTAVELVKRLRDFEWAKAAPPETPAKPKQELAPDRTPWVGPMSPDDWTKEIGYSLTTLKRWRDDGKLVVDEVTTKLWRISRASLERCRRSKTN